MIVSSIREHNILLDIRLIPVLKQQMGESCAYPISNGLHFVPAVTYVLVKKKQILIVFMYQS